MVQVLLKLSAELFFLSFVVIVYIVSARRRLLAQCIDFLLDSVVLSDNAFERTLSTWQQRAMSVLREVGTGIQ